MRDRKGDDNRRGKKREEEDLWRERGKIKE